MSDPAALVPVPFYAPARIRTGNAETFFNHGQRARATTHVVHQQQTDAPGAGIGLGYDQRGAVVRDPSLGWIVNIWV
jgi:hypothetical protein